MPLDRLIQKYLGKEVYLTHGKCRIVCTVHEVKTSYGKSRFLVAPLWGKGSTWVEKVTLIKPKKV